MEKKTIRMPGGMFTLRPMKKEEAALAKQMCDLCVGKNLYSLDTLEAAAEDLHKRFLLLFDPKGQAAGYIYYYPDTAEAFAKASGATPEAFTAVSNGPFGKLQSLGLLPPYRGWGLAASMLRLALEDLSGDGVEAVFALCWKTGDVVPLKQTVEECGFRFLRKVSRPWYDDAELICPYCGGRCVCDAEIYFYTKENGL